MWEIFVFESQISHAIKKQKNFFIKTTKGNAGLSEKEAREFSLLYFIFKTFKDPQTLFSHIQTSAVKCKYPTLIVRSREFKIRRRGQQRERTIGLISKRTTLHVHHDFLYISFLFSHDYYVKLNA